MIDATVLGNPAVLVIIIGVSGVAVLLALGVMKSLQNPTKRANFDEALMYIQGSELEIDTALNNNEKSRRSWFDYWSDASDKTGKIVRDRNTPGRVALGIAIFTGMFGFLVYPGGILGLLLAPIGVLGYKTWLGGEARKRIVAMEKQLPQLLSGMRANLQAGATPQAAIVSVADDLPSPLGDELRLLKRDLDVNVALEDGLRSLAARVPSREMQFFVSSVEIAIRSGADLDPQILTIQQIVAQRTRIRQKLTAAVGQVKPTKYLALGAVPLMFFVSFQNAENRTYWFGTGVFMLGIAVVLYGLGFFVIRTMVKSVENT